LQTFVLIPGAWLGGWSWQPVARLLAGRGYPVLALNLPGLSYDGSPAGLGMADAVDYVAGEVERRDASRFRLGATHCVGAYLCFCTRRRAYWPCIVGSIRISLRLLCVGSVVTAGLESSGCFSSIKEGREVSD